MTTIAIDPGHGGKDPGAIGNGLQEKNVTLAISKKVAELLKAQKLNVILTRTIDKFIDLTPERTPKCDLASASTSTPVAVRALRHGCHFSISRRSRKLGQAIQDNILKLAPFKNRGLKTRANSKTTQTTSICYDRPRECLCWLNADS